MRVLYNVHSYWDLSCYCCGFDGAWDLLSWRWRRKSIVAVARCRHCQAMQFLKKSRTQYRKYNETDGEYKTLRILNGGDRKSATYLVPFAYQYSGRACALSMEYIGGASMDKMLVHAKTMIEFDAYLRLAGGWLKGFHNARLAQYCTPGDDAATIVERLANRSGALMARYPEAARAVRLMRHLIQRGQYASATTVALHGDCKASNLICGDDIKVYGVDFSLKRSGPGSMDIGQFIVDILLNRNGRTLIGDGFVSHVVDVFLQAYNGASVPRDEIVLWLLYFCVSHWNSSVAGKRLWAGGIGRFCAICSALMDVARTPDVSGGIPIRRI